MNNKDKGNMFKLACSFLLERFEYFLDDYAGAYGTMFLYKADTSKEINDLWEIHRKIMEDGVIVRGYSIIDNHDGKFSIDFDNPAHRPINRIVENLIFQKDDDNNFLQIADMAVSKGCGSH